MKVELKHMGIPLEGLEKESFVLDLDEGATIQTLVDTLMKQHSHLTTAHFKTTSFMIDGKVADKDSPLHDGNKILLMRILGGG